MNYKQEYPKLKERLLNLEEDHFQRDLEARKKIAAYKIQIKQISESVSIKVRRTPLNNVRYFK